MKFEIMKANVPNKNNRIYPLDVLNKMIEQVQPAISERRFLGQLGYPDEAVVQFGQVSHMVTDLRMEDDSMVAEIEVLNTPNGKELKKMLDEDKVAFRIFALGTGKINEDGMLVISENSKLVSINAMSPEIAS